MTRLRSTPPRPPNAWASPSNARPSPPTPPAWRNTASRGCGRAPMAPSVPCLMAPSFVHPSRWLASNRRSNAGRNPSRSPVTPMGTSIGTPRCAFPAPVGSNSSIPPRMAPSNVPSFTSLTAPAWSRASTTSTIPSRASHAAASSTRSPRARTCGLPPRTPSRRRTTTASRTSSPTCTTPNTRKGSQQRASRTSTPSSTTSQPAS